MCFFVFFHPLLEGKDMGGIGHPMKNDIIHDDDMLTFNKFCGKGKCKKW
jgi:hypothetical protein